MKILALFFILSNLLLSTEDTILPKNEVGRVKFEEMVPVKNLEKEVLFNNAAKYVSSIKKVKKRKSDLKTDYSGGTLFKKGSFYVYTQGLITPQIHGEITYNVKLEVFEGGYKYTFSDFVFNYYQRNRYGRYAPVSGKYKPLEEEKFAGMQKTWQSHKQLTKDHIEAQIEQLKNVMEDLPTGAPSVRENQKTGIE